MAAPGSVKPSDIVTKDAVTYWVLSADPGTRVLSCEKTDGTGGRFRLAEADVTIVGSRPIVSGQGVQASYFNR